MDAVVCNRIEVCVKDRAVLRHLSFSIQEESIVGLLGVNGAGKTTVVKSLAGSLPIRSGSLSVFGYSPALQMEKTRPLVGVVTNSAKLYGYMTALQNLSFFGKLNGLSGQESMERASYVMRLLEIWKNKDEPVSKLDTEIKSKLSIARALMGKPRLLLLDEPVKGMDIQAAEETNFAIKTIAAEEKISVLITSEDPEDLNVCDSFLIIDQGRNVASGNLETLQQKAKVKNRAVIKVKQGDLTVPGIEMEMTGEGVFQKDLESPEYISELVRNAVYEGADILEALVIRPNLADIYKKLVDTSEDR